MHHILIPFDGSEAAGRAVEHVIALQQQCGGLKVTLLNVQELPYMRGDELVVSLTDQVAHNLIDAGTRLLAGPAEQLRAAGVEVATVVEADAPARAIAEQAASRACDTIVMGTRGLGQLSGALLGSVAYKTVHQVEVPVTLVK